MVAQGFKNGALVCTFEKPVVPVDQNGYDIDTLVIDGVSHDVSPPPAPTENLTDVEKMAAGIQERLDQRQLERTGIKPDPKGAVPRTRALAAAAMSLGGWGYPSVAALTGDAEVVAILAALYADPTSNTTAESSNTAKRRAVQYVRIMAEGAAFGEEYSDALTAYERTASPGIQGAITADQRDWMALPCGPWATVKAMFLALLK